MEDVKNTSVNEEVEGGATESKDNEVQEKTLTQSEVNEAMTKRLARERAKWEKEFTQKLESEKAEAEKLAKLNAEEKAKYEFEKKVKEFEAREKELAKKELSIEVGTQLKDLGISVNATRFVLGEDAETTHENIKEFEKLVSEIKEDLKKELLKGKTPKSSVVNGNGNDNPYTKEGWSLTKQMELEMTNPVLAKQLMQSAK